MNKGTFEDDLTLNESKNDNNLMSTQTAFSNQFNETDSFIKNQPQFNNSLNESNYKQELPTGLIPNNILEPDFDADLEINAFIIDPTDQSKVDDKTTIVQNETINEPNETIDESNKKMITWNGKRPFAGAVEQYMHILNNSVYNAKQYLVSNPQHAYAKIKLPLFQKISVECKDISGNPFQKTYRIHEAHYGPMIHRTYNTNHTDVHEKWFHFMNNRYNHIWFLLNQDNELQNKELQNKELQNNDLQNKELQNKDLQNNELQNEELQNNELQNNEIQNNDEIAKEKYVFSPFQNVQLSLLKENLYLIDLSDTIYDQSKGMLRYNIDIRLYKKIPPYGPYSQGIGFISNLASPITYANNQGQYGYLGYHENMNYLPVRVSVPVPVPVPVHAPVTMMKMYPNLQMQREQFNVPMQKEQFKEPMQRKQFKEPMQREQFEGPMQRKQFKEPMQREELKEPLQRDMYYGQRTRGYSYAPKTRGGHTNGTRPRGGHLYYQGTKISDNSNDNYIEHDVNNDGSIVSNKQLNEKKSYDAGFYES